MSKSIQELQDIANEVRVSIVKMVHTANSGHMGGAMSFADMLTALFYNKLNYDPKNPKWEDRDRFVLSSGHMCAGLYTILAKIGVFDEKELWNFRQLGSSLQGHPKYNLDLGIEMSTGSLGQGLSVANGMALAARVQNKKYRVYSLETDGGSQEGMVWEAAMLAAHYKLDNRCVLFDYNNVQIDGFCSDVMDLGSVADKFKAFGWHVIEIDGHDMQACCDALDEAEKVKGKPQAIISKTTLGKGVSVFENKSKFHGTPPTDEEFAIAMKELGN
ncbi:MAG: transketolase [bacterium]